MKGVVQINYLYLKYSSNNDSSDDRGVDRKIPHISKSE
jgi:hypothetical protein